MAESWWCVSFCIRCFCTLSQHNKNEEHSKEHSSFLVRCRSRHSVSKGPPDLSPKFFRFAQNLDTRVRVPTTQNNKKVIRYKYLMTFLVCLVQTYSVFKQIAKSICNEYSICFSSQKLPYSGASVFVLWGSSPYNPK